MGLALRHSGVDDRLRPSWQPRATPQCSAGTGDRGGGAAGLRQEPERAARRLVGLVLLVALALIARRRRPDLYRPRPRRTPIFWRCWRVLGTVGVFALFALASGILQFAGREPGQSAAQGGGRQRLRRHRGHRPGGPRVLRQRHLSRPDRRGRRQRCAADRAGLHRRSRRLRGDLPPAQGRARGPPPAGGSARSRRRRRRRRAGCACACARSARASATRA